jgi:hypothetical protein
MFIQSCFHQSCTALCLIYVRTCKSPSKILTLNMATVMFAEMLEHLPTFNVAYSRKLKLYRVVPLISLLFGEFAMKWYLHMQKYLTIKHTFQKFHWNISHRGLGTIVLYTSEPKCLVSWNLLFWCFTVVFCNGKCNKYWTIYQMLKNYCVPWN